MRGSDGDALLELDRVVAGYGRSDIVLDALSVEVQPNRVTAILGPNGSGKSTCLRAIVGMVNVREGEILFRGSDISHLPTHQRTSLGIGLLTQGHSVFPEMTVEENLLLGGWPFGRDGEKVRAALARAYEQYPPLADFRSKKAGALSGGQQRLLEIARLMLPDPELVLIDEPSVGLAPVLVDEIYAEIERLKDMGKTVLLVDQNVQAAVELADYVYILEFGRVKSAGTVDEYASDVSAIVRDWLRT